MAIPTLAQITAAIGNREVSHVENLISARLSTEGTVAFLNDPKVTDKTLKYSFDGIFLSESQRALLVEALTEAGWEGAAVTNGTAPVYTGIGHQPRPYNWNSSLNVQFKPAAAPAPEPGEDDTETPPAGG